MSKHPKQVANIFCPECRKYVYTCPVVGKKKGEDGKVLLKFDLDYPKGLLSLVCPHCDHRFELGDKIIVKVENVH